MVRGQAPAAAPTGAPKLRRQRASPARLVKLYKDLTADQKKRIELIGFGGLLKIASRALPSAFADWVMGSCFDPVSSQLVLPGRGRVAVNKDSVYDVLRVPKDGDKVKYEMNVEAINFIHDKFSLVEGAAPSIDFILERIKKNKSDDEDFLRSWLMIAISTFLCPTTGSSISPRCYPALIDLSKVNNLDWCQFVVDQLKVSASKVGKRNSFNGCLHVLVILYADSVMLDNIVIPPTTPRIAAWSKQLLDQVISLDTRPDGSFGILKLKETSYCTPQNSLFNMEDIRSFVSTKVHSSISNQQKEALTNAATQFCCGFTELLGSFLEQVSASDGSEPQRVGSTNRRGSSRAQCEASSGQRERRATFEVVSDGEAAAAQHVCSSKHQRSSRTQGEPSCRRSKRSKLQEVGASHGQILTRSMMKRTSGNEVLSLGEDYEEDQEEEIGDYDSDDDEDELDEGEDDDYGEGDGYDRPPDDDGCGDVKDNAPDGDGKGLGKDEVPQGQAQGAAPLQKEFTMQPSTGQAQGEAQGEAQVDDIEDHVTLLARLQRMQKSYRDPEPLEVVPPIATVRSKSSARRLKEKLKIRPPGDFTPPKIDIMQFIDTPPRPSISVDCPEAAPIQVDPKPPSDNSVWSKSSARRLERLKRLPGDFTPPKIDIMQFIETPPRPSISVDCPEAAPIQVDPTPPSDNSDWSLSGVPEDEWARIESEARRTLEMRKRKHTVDSDLDKEVLSHIPPNSTHNQLSKSDDSVPKEPPKTSTDIPLNSTPKGTASALHGSTSSVSPSYSPHPRRTKKTTAVMRSPYIDYSSKTSFRVPSIVSALYNAVCAYGTRRAASSQEADVVIIMYWSFFATLGNVAASVKPCGKLMSPVAEVGIYAINEKGKKATKRVLPLRISYYLLRGELDKSEVKQVFRKPDNHLDHRQMVMFPVLQILGEGDAEVGHYFLLVLNLRNKRFEVLDSMRSLEDEALSDCCNILIHAIKELWIKWKYEEKKPISSFKPFDIGVPIQTNNHDCGFHMLMHAEHWDGHKMQYFKESDIPSIRKILLYKWASHKDNEAKTDIKRVLNLDL